MEPKIIEARPKTVIANTSFATVSLEDSANLWKSFMMKHKQIENRIEGAFYSVQVYPEGMQMQEFTEETKFERWAAVEVSEPGDFPDDFEARTIPGGTYAVFVHKGSVKQFVDTSNYIYGEWLPNSKYMVDDRPHFECLGEKYLGPENPESEEEIWVPVKDRIKN